ncbi:hypothetical protein PG990_007225 [Apiospora arundinis]
MVNAAAHALSSRMICYMIMAHLPDLETLRRVIRLNSTFYHVFQNSDPERIKLQIVLDHMDIGVFHYALVASKCKDVAIYDGTATREFLDSHLISLERNRQQQWPPTVHAVLDPREKRNLLDVAEYEKQVRYLADKYIETEIRTRMPIYLGSWMFQPRPIPKERFMKTFLLFRIMCTLFPILHTHNDDPFRAQANMGNSLNSSRLARDIPEKEFQDMLAVEHWLKRQCKPYVEYFFRSVGQPLDDCQKHKKNKPMASSPFSATTKWDNFNNGFSSRSHTAAAATSSDEEKCPALDEFIMTAGLDNLVRILRGQDFDYIGHLNWVRNHPYHGKVSVTYARRALLGHDMLWSPMFNNINY